MTGDNSDDTDYEAQFTGFDAFPTDPSPREMCQWYQRRSAQTDELLEDINDLLIDEETDLRLSPRRHEEGGLGRKERITFNGIIGDGFGRDYGSWATRVPRYVQATVEELDGWGADIGGAYPCLLVHLHQREVIVGQNFAPYTGTPSPDMLIELADELARFCDERDAMLVLMGETPSHPDTENEPVLFERKEEIADAMRNREGLWNSEPGMKRLLLGHRYDEAAHDSTALIRQLVSDLQQIPRQLRENFPQFQDYLPTGKRQVTDWIEERESKVEESKIVEFKEDIKEIRVSSGSGSSCGDNGESQGRDINCDTSSMFPSDEELRENSVELDPEEIPEDATTEELRRLIQQKLEDE